MVCEGGNGRRGGRVTSPGPGTDPVRSQPAHKRRITVKPGKGLTTEGSSRNVYSPGYRVLINSLGSNDRMALTWGLPAGLSTMDLKNRLTEKYASLNPIKPTVVKDGPVMENVLTGDAVDLFKFPTPLWHEDDGGRYIGTGSVDITI